MSSAILCKYCLNRIPIFKRNRWILLSLPSRKRGLKLSRSVILRLIVCRFPRGSVDWNHFNHFFLSSSCVASLAEAWIEIYPCCLTIPPDMVASLAEAWIEIFKSFTELLTGKVASLAEAWIEIRRKCFAPSWHRVASLAEAWIEIWRASFYVRIVRSRFPRGSVDWNICIIIRILGTWSRFPRGSVDWNGMLMWSSNHAHRRFPRGSVDWNVWFYHLKTSLPSRFPRGSVDWNWFSSVSVASLSTSLPSRKRGLKFLGFPINPSSSGRFPRGSVDWNIFPGLHQLWPPYVASLAEAWIEMVKVLLDKPLYRSLPSRKRGLKSPMRCLPDLGGKLFSFTKGN